VFAYFRRQFRPAIRDGAPQVDATAGAVVLVAGLDVGGTRPQTETAVDAVHEGLVIDVAAQPLPGGLVDDRGGSAAGRRRGHCRGCFWGERKKKGQSRSKSRVMSLACLSDSGSRSVSSLAGLPWSTRSI